MSQLKHLGMCMTARLTSASCGSRQWLETLRQVTSAKLQVMHLGEKVSIEIVLEKSVFFWFLFLYVFFILFLFLFLLLFLFWK